MSGARTRKETLAEGLVATLADEIVSGRRPPGTALDEVTLAGDFAVSRTPVREALRQLAATGLVAIRPHRGAVVAKPYSADLSGMFLVMGELEALAAALSAVAMTRDERRALVALHEQMAGLVRAGDLLAYSRANVDFHVAIYAGAHNAYLAELASQTRRRLAPFRRAQLELADRLARSHLEHGAVVAAIERADGEGANRAMRDHIGLSAQAWDVMAHQGAAVPTSEVNNI
ncbi:MAG: GntR family transcriptional regulator [Alphaproteobacteria bacterium]